MLSNVGSGGGAAAAPAGGAGGAAAGGAAPEAEKEEEKKEEGTLRPLAQHRVLPELSHIEKELTGSPYREGGVGRRHGLRAVRLSVRLWKGLNLLIPTCLAWVRCMEPPYTAIKSQKLFHPAFRDRLGPGLIVIFMPGCKIVTFDMDPRRSAYSPLCLKSYAARA